MLCTYGGVAFLTGALICMTGNCVRAMVNNVTQPAARGTAFALFNLSDDLGRGLGPLAVAILVEGFGGRRRPAFCVATLGWLLCGALNTAAACTLERDLTRVARKADRAQALADKGLAAGKAGGRWGVRGEEGERRGQGDAGRDPVLRRGKGQYELV